MIVLHAFLAGALFDFALRDLLDKRYSRAALAGLIATGNLYKALSL